MDPTRISFGYRLSTALVGAAVIVWLSLAPSDALPSVDLWDKAEHAFAYAALTVAWAMAFPRRIWWVALGLLALGIAIELAQAAMHFGRVGHLYDVAANGVGIALGLVVAALLKVARRL